jgi:hypothetical protein
LITFLLLCGQIFEDSVELQRIFIRARDELGENGKRLSSRAYEYTLTTMGRLPAGFRSDPHWFNAYPDLAFL